MVEIKVNLSFLQISLSYNKNTVAELFHLIDETGPIFLVFYKNRPVTDGFSIHALDHTNYCIGS
jgi:hypothetical protein